MTEEEPDFYLSAPLRMRRGDRLAVLRPTRQNEVLAFLLARANSTVPVTELAAGVWPDPRQDGVGQIRPYVSKLRRELEGTDASLVNRTHRYTLEIDPMRVDLLRFDGLLATADKADDLVRQRQLVDDALVACPQEKLLGDFTRAWAYEARAVHQKRWDDAALRRNAYWLRDGDHDRLLDVLRQAGVHRLVEGQWVYDYLLTLYRCDRPDEALEHFALIDRRLRERKESPSERLRTLAEAIRRRDRSLEPSRTASVMVPATTRPSPNMLPPPAEPLVGRHTEVQAIRAHADRRTHDTVRIVGIYGPPGIGKTALATEYAHRHQARYPGGVLYADFGAFSGRVTTTTDAVLAAFLAALDVSGERLPPGTSARVDLYRDLTRQRRILTVLDNVMSTSSVAQLLPTAPGSLVLVTSRRRMTTLTSRHGAHPVVLGRLDTRAAIGLLDRFLRARPDYEVEVAAQIAKACEGHPLALCLAGARIATRPEEPMRVLAAALSRPAGRIAALDEYAEEGDAVADVFGWSYRKLDPNAVGVFRFLGIAPSPSLGATSIGELTGLPGARLRAAIEELDEAHLLISLGGDRYALQDLLREYALALESESDANRRAALDPLYAYHRRMVRGAARRLWPTEMPAAEDVFADRASALGWLNGHREEVLAAVLHEAGAQRPEHVLEISSCLFRYLDHGGHLDQSVELNAAAVAAARRRLDGSAIAAALTRQGAILVRVGRSDDAYAALREAQDLYRTLEDERGQAAVLGNLGRASFRRGELPAARDLQLEALHLFRACGDRLGEARTLTNLGVVCESMNNLAAALGYYEQALATARGFEAPDAVARALGGVGGAQLGQGRLGDALRSYEEALEIFRRLGDRVGEATTMTNLGLVHAGLDRPRDAAELHQQALAIFEQIGDRPNTAETLNNLAAALLADGRPAEAIRRYEEGLASARLIKERVQVARSHAGLSAAHARLGVAAGAGSPDHTAQARHHLAEASACYGELGIALPAEVRHAANNLRAGA